MWLWVFVFGGIALAGLIMLVCYAVWLAHKTADVYSELTVLAERTGKMMDLLAQIQVPSQLGGTAGPVEGRIVDDRDDDFVRSGHGADKPW
ncbi:MAG TPA: hypothetical protein VFP34_12390 [Microlunatus sp.]|nr:hypothetical protein [Microlunatus sp.]